MSLLARGLLAAVLLLAPLTAAAPATAAGPAAPPTGPAAAPAPLHRAERALPDQYVVTLRTLDPAAFAERLGITPQFTYSTVLRGFAAVLTPAQLRAVRMSAEVVAVEENTTATAYDLGTTPPPAAERAVPGASSAAAASWGLDRIDQRALPLDGRFTTTGRGAGTTAYILDSGIDYAHSEFGGRAVPGYDAMGDGRNGQDCQGHGTHVAGTVAGATYGVAPEANLVSVRVLGCDGRGTLAGMIAGFDWIARNAQQPAVVNASLGGPFSPTVNAAADRLADRGVLPVVAAGNDNRDACEVSPASAARGFTLGATDRADQEAWFSNHGRCLELYAPGADIVSARLGGGSVAQNGTSMASPHAAGVALLYKEANPAAGPAEVADQLRAQATADVLTVDAGSPDRLLFTGGL